ncbi:MAG: TonB-dependent receptor, partial [Bacteroidales bacterium]|nr:TonB-dependent receptor [Bacteroidales bacterium]
MKFKSIVILFIFNLLSFIVSGQYETDANIFGDVQCDGKHIPYVNVFIMGTTIGTTTDATGHYNLVNLPEGKHTIRVQGLGYKPVEQEVINSKDKSVEIKFIVEEDVFLMEQVVVTSDRNEINRKEAPVIVNVITPKDFDSRQSNTLIDGLDFIPGLRTEYNCQNCGFTQLRMNGLDGPYSQILINSRPVFSGLAGVYGLELLPANMIQRVEIVRGGGSALFGGNAIAGTVNVITKEPVSNTFQIGTDFSSIGIGHHEGGELALDRSLKFNGSLVTNDSKSGLFLYGMTRNRDPYDENNDGFTEMVRLKNNSIGFNSYFKPGKLSKISLDFYKLNETRRGGNKLDQLPHETDITEMVDHDITGIGLNYERFTQKGNKFSIYGAGQYIDRASYYGAMQDETAYGQTYDLTYSLGLQYTYKTDNLLFLPATITTGADNTNGTLKDEKLGVLGESNTMIANQRTNTTGLFLQNEWQSDKAKILIGLRFDRYSISDRNHSEKKPVSENVIIPRATFLYDFADNLQFRLSYAKGYRAPQIFDEDLHIETSGARRITHSNDPNLKQETSHSFSSSINTHKTHKNILYEILVEGFYTRLNNPFANIYSPADSLGNVKYIRINAHSGAFVAGVNTELNIATIKNHTLQIGFTFQTSQYEESQPWGEEEGNVSKNFMRTPNQYGYITYSTKPLKSFELSITGTYTGSMLVPHFGLDPETTVLAEQEAIANGDIITGEKLATSKPFLD